MRLTSEQESHAQSLRLVPVTVGSVVCGILKERRLSQSLLLFCKTSFCAWNSRIGVAGPLE